MELNIDGSSKQFKTIFFGDYLEGGDSEIVSLPDSSKCCLTYRIGDTVTYPFVGCGFSVTDTSQLLDLSLYEKMTIALDSNFCDSFTMALNFFTPGVSILDNGASQLPLLRDIVHRGEQTIVFSLSELTNSSFWQRVCLYGKMEKAVLSVEKLAGITFESHEHFLRGDQHKIGVLGITLTKDKAKATRKAFVWFVYSLLPLIVLLLLLHRSRVFRQIKRVVIVVRVRFNV